MEEPAAERLPAHLLTDHHSEVVLGVTVTPANDPDGPEARPPGGRGQGGGVPVVEVLGDTAYGDGDTREAVEDVGARVTAKTQPPATTGRFVKTTSSSTPDAPSATCPAGHTTTTYGRRTDHQGRVSWS